MINQRLIPLALAATTLCALPAAASAKSITFGHRLDHEPSNSAPAHNCREDGSDDPTPACTRVAIDASGGAVAAGLTAPSNGTITKFKIRAGAPGSLKFVVVRLKGLQRGVVTNGLGETQHEMVAKGKVVAKGPAVQVRGLGFDEDTTNPVETFAANVKVKKGDYIGIQSTETSALYCSGGGDNQLIFSPALKNVFQQSNATSGCNLLVQAVMKPKH